MKPKKRDRERERGREREGERKKTNNNNLTIIKKRFMESYLRCRWDRRKPKKENKRFQKGKKERER